MEYKINFSQETITFTDKPNQNIRAMLKFKGFRWSPRDKYWYRVCGTSWDFLETLEREIDKINGVRRPDGACWDCKDENGFFRAYGAATPVLCDACEQKRKTA